MKKFLFGLILGAVLGAFGYSYYQNKDTHRTLDDARESMSTGAGKVKDAIQDKIDTQEIKKELERTSMVVRDKAKKAGSAIADATADARITTAIKSKLVTESALPVFNIHVETTDGLVTLSGTVNSHDQISRAVQLALDTDGVIKVVSTLQVKAGK
ncbi:MAG TPA: BON domain-containing protein [Candidatus Saccharimonadales bacterium]|nr:BON domain-containing protein [Candidatus Saccharimonadales bacterium]